MATKFLDWSEPILLISRIRAFNTDMNIPEHLDALKAEDVETIADCALLEGNPLYPVPKIMNKQQCVALIRKIGGLDD